MKNFTEFFLKTALLLLLISFTNGYAQSKQSNDALLAGNWGGKLKIEAQELTIYIKIKLTNEGYYKALLDSPDQGAKDIPLDTVILSGKNLRTASKMIGGEFEGTVDFDSLIIKGVWKQGGMNLPLTVNKTMESIEPKRPQTPKPPFPYKDEEVTIENKTDNIKLAGTLTLPASDGTCPAVVLITGSGAQDRDETLFGHKPFWVIADYLTRSGIAVLRMDDRGVGKSGGNFAKATTFDFTNDILAAVDFLKTRKEINKKQIGLIGHSEGGLIAPLAASKSADVAYIVMLAGPGVKGEELILLQSELILRAMQMPENMIQKNTLLMKSVFGVILEDADSASTFNRLNAIIKEFMEGLSDEEKANPVFNQEAMQKQLTQLYSPWFKLFLRYDPAGALEKVKCPALALNGGNDLQVSAKQNLPPIKEALTKGGNAKFEIKELPGLNHLFQRAATGSLDEYPKIEETISPEVLKIIGDWIHKTVKTLN